MTMPVGSAGSEDLDTDMWIDNRLKTATYLNGVSPGLGLNGRIYGGLAPSDEEFPYVVWAMQSGTDYAVFGATGARLAVDFLYQVSMLTASNDPAHVKMMTDELTRIMSVPHDTVIRTAEDGSVWNSVFSSTRHMPLSFSENHTGRTVWHKGAIYRITTQSFMVSDVTPGTPMAGVSDGSSPVYLP